jgi:hypothetical protein
LWPDAPKRAANIREKGEIYRQQGLPQTGNLLLELAQVVETGQDDKREIVFNQIAPTFREEYSARDADFLALYDFIEDTLIGSISTVKAAFRDKLLELSPLLTLMRKSATVMGKIASSFLAAGHLSNEERYYAACLLHAMDIEGQFDEACRLMYVLFKASLGENVLLAQAADLSAKRYARPNEAAQQRQF